MSNTRDRNGGARGAAELVAIGDDDIATLDGDIPREGAGVVSGETKGAIARLGETGGSCEYGRNRRLIGSKTIVVHRDDRRGNSSIRSQCQCFVRGRRNGVSVRIEGDTSCLDVSSQ